MLLRRILRGWFHPGKTKRIPQRAFKPREWVSSDRPGDLDGLSVFRKKIASIEAAATRPDNGEKQHVAVFPAKIVFDLGLNINPKPDPAEAGEALILELKSSPPGTDHDLVQIEEWAIAIRDSASIIYEAE